MKLFLFVYLSVFLLHVRAQNGHRCNEPVDIAVLLDTSSYVGANNFMQVKFFVKNFIDYFHMTRSGLNPFIGFVPYSDRVIKNKMINFRYSTSARRLKGKVDEIPYDGSSGFGLDLALKYARDTLFTRFKGSRSWVPRVVLVITASARDWNSNQKNTIQREAERIKKTGSQLMIVSIGPVSSNDGFLRSIVDSTDHLHTVLFPYLLYEISKKLTNQICPEPIMIDCPGKVDIAFIVDSSGSISNPDYIKMKYFMYSIAKAVNISDTGARAGIVIYSKTAEMVARFTDHLHLKSFKKVVYRLKHMKSFTRIDLGLHVANTQLFSPVIGGARPGVKKLAFILTDGRQTAVEGTKISLHDAARPLINKDIKTIAIGIGGSVDKHELRAMVQDDEDVIEAKNFDELVKSIQNITRFTCEQITIVPCRHSADIVFALDTSSHLSSDDFILMKEFLVDVEKRLRIGRYKNRYGVILYGSRAHEQLDLGDIDNSTSFANTVKNLPRLGGGRVSYKALERAQNMLYNTSESARRHVPKVVVWITSGPEESFANTLYIYQAAKRLRDRNVILKIVGVGSSRASDLERVAGSPRDIFVPDSVNTLSQMIPAFTKDVCSEISPLPCKRTLDVAFIVDSSGSILNDKFTEAKNLVEMIADTLEISWRKTHIALMVYSDTANITSTFNDIYSRNDLTTQLNLLPHLRGRTRIDLALKLANSDLFTRRAGMRSSFPNVAVVITDGRQSPAADAIRLDEAVAPLLVRRVKVISIGVGKRIDRQELHMMVESPEMSFWAENYRDIRLQLSAISKHVCSSN